MATDTDTPGAAGSNTRGLAPILWAGLLSGLTGCTQLADNRAVLVEVGNISLDETDLRDYEARLPEYLKSASSGEAGIRDVLGGLVDRGIMVMEARKLGYFDAVEVRERLRTSVVDWLTRHTLEAAIGDSVRISPAEEEQAYHNGWNRRVWLSHIELGDEASARQIARQLASGGDFAALARTRSRAPDASKGGDLGRYFSIAELPSTMAAAIRHLKSGDVSDVIDTGRGFEIIKVTAADTVAFEEVAEHLRHSLQRRAVGEAQDQLLVELESHFGLVYDGAAIARVQGQASVQGSFLEASQSSRPLVVRRPDLVLLRSADGLHLLRSGGLGREAITDSSSFVAALRSRVLADSLLVWEARERGFDRDPAFDRFLRRRHEKLAVIHLRKREVIEHIVITDGDLRRRYESDLAEYSVPPTTQITEIFTDSSRLARQLLRRLEAGEDMVELSRRYSTRADGVHGHRHVDDVAAADEEGGLAEIREALRGHGVGSLIGPIDLGDKGFAIVRIEGHQETRVRTLESVRPVLEYKLKRENNAAEFERYMLTLRQEYSGEVIWHDEAIADLARRGF